MRLLAKSLLIAFVILGLTSVCQAHFGMILPDKSMVMQGDNPNLEMTLAFLHPFEQKGMPMAKPKSLWRSGGQGENRSLKHSPGNQGPGPAGLESRLRPEKAGHLCLLF